MTPGVATKVIAASCALTAFSVCIVAGLFAGNPAETILGRALLGLVAGNVVGLIVGTVGERTVVEGLRTYQKNRPVPGEQEAPSADPAQLSA